MNPRTQNINFEGSSKKAWSLLKKLDDGKPQTGPSSKSANKVTSRFVSLSRSTGETDRNKAGELRKQIKTSMNEANLESEFFKYFSTSEIIETLKEIKTGIDGIFSEYLKQC